MQSIKLVLVGLAVICYLVGTFVGSADATWAFAAIANPTTTPTVYQYRDRHSPDGIGKFYMGREIAQVMGHTGTMWLERPDREVQEQPQQVIAALNLKPMDVVADIGAGTGYFSFRIAPLVPQGKVLAVDAQPEMIDILQFLKAENGTHNVEMVLGDVDNPKLEPESINLALMVDTYHELEYPHEMMQAIARSLKPRGSVVLVEYRRENPFILIKTLHKMTEKKTRREMEAVGLVWQSTQEFLPQQHVMVFAKA
jgi:ubiquinone/menaquinone biosynthesis C-methylase UbiE